MVVGVLGILALLAVAFVTLAQLERRASQQRLYGTQALFLARSGLEDALARLSAGQASVYGGENWDGSTDGLLSAYEAAQESYRITGANTPADLQACPVRHALRPSFFARFSPGNPDPALVGVEGRLRGYSGTLFGNTYALKVEDESAKINVNGGFLDGADRDYDGIPDCRDPSVAAEAPIWYGRFPPPNPGRMLNGRGWNDQLKRILGILGEQPEVAIPTLGTDVLANRPPGGYRSIAELQSRIGTSVDLSPFLTVSSWTDGKVVRPNAWAQEGMWENTNLDLVKLHRMQLAPEEGGRAPVNLNAASRPVLVALLQDLKGLSWPQDRAGTGYLTYTISPALAPALADALLAGRPFRSWGEFSRFCDGLVPGTLAGFPGLYGVGNLCAADLLKANFDPNTRLNKELPDEILWRWIDKSDLLAWSTEGSLGPTGRFRVSAVGRLLSKGGRLLAQAEVASDLEAFCPLVQTTQRDFVSGRRPDDTRASYLSLANPAPLNGALPQRTTGASDADSPCGWHSWGTSQGLAAVTYPCSPAALPGQAADFDGRIGLASVELPPTPPSNGTLHFLHHFDDSLDADFGENRSPQGTGNEDQLFLWPMEPSVWPAEFAIPSTLYPDGLHLQTGASPDFFAEGNFPPATPTSRGTPGNHAVFGYWVKPLNYYHAGRQQADVFMTRGWDLPDSSQVLGIGRMYYTGSQLTCWRVMAENMALPAPTYEWTDALNGLPGYERAYDVKPSCWLQPDLRWKLVTAVVNTGSTGRGSDVHLSVRGIQPGPLQEDFDAGYAASYDLDHNEDLVQPGASTLFTLGASFTDAHSMHTGPNPILQGANQVMDEFAIVDFGADETLGLLRAGIWSDRRYADGRYYKGDDAHFLSAPLSAPSGLPARILSVRWTEVSPAEAFTEFQWSGVGPPPAAGTPRLGDASLASWLELELLPATGALDTPAICPLVQDGFVGRAFGAFRYRVRFRTALASPLDEPVLETPFLDDVTFRLQDASGPRILGWTRS